MRRQRTQWILGLGSAVLLGIGAAGILRGAIQSPLDSPDAYHPGVYPAHMTDDRLRQLFIRNEALGMGSRAFARIVLSDTPEKMARDAEQLDRDLMQLELRSRLLWLRRNVPGLPESLTRERLGQLIVQHGFASIHDPVFQRVLRKDSPETAGADAYRLDSDLEALASRLAEKRRLRRETQASP